MLWTCCGLVAQLCLSTCSLAYSLYFLFTCLQESTDDDILAVLAACSCIIAVHTAVLFRLTCRCCSSRNFALFKTKAPCLDQRDMCNKQHDRAWSYGVWQYDISKVCTVLLLLLKRWSEWSLAATYEVVSQSCCTCDHIFIINSQIISETVRVFLILFCVSL